MFKEEELRTLTLDLLKKRGVELEDIASLVTQLQSPFNPAVNNEMSMYFVERTLRKREVQMTILTAIQLDILAENKQLMSPLQEIIEEDRPLYGTDESLAMAIVNVYGSIGLTNFGYLDKVKPGIIGQLDQAREGSVHTFLDDIIGAIAAAAASSLAHAHPDVSDSFH